MFNNIKKMFYDDDDEMCLLSSPEKNEYYYLKIVNDTRNTDNISKKVKIEFNDHFCISYNDKLLYEISYYNISKWKYGNKIWGINYVNNNKKFILFFKLNNNESMIITNSIKKKINELIEYTNINIDKI